MTKIAMCIATRGRPKQLETTIRVLDQLASGENEIQYVAGIDLDDALTQNYLDNEMYDFWIKRSVAARPDTLGQVWNRCYKTVEADIYQPMVDDAVCLTPNWDLHMVEALRGAHGSSWQCMIGKVVPLDPIAPFFTRAWCDAVGNLAIDLFPYWFTDTWSQEVYEFAFGRPLQQWNSLWLGGKRGKTASMRELDFWWGFFNATRPLRIEEALNISEQLSDGNPKYIPFVEKQRERDRMARAHMQEISSNMGENGGNTPASARYLAAKAVAEDLLKTNGLKLWGDLPSAGITTAM